MTWVINPTVGCHYFPPGQQLPPRPLRGLLQFRCFNRGTMGVNSLPKTVTRQRRGCDLNPGPTAPESSTLTTRLPSHLLMIDCWAKFKFSQSLSLWPKCAKWSFQVSLWLLTYPDVRYRSSLSSVRTHIECCFFYLKVKTANVIIGQNGFFVEGYDISLLISIVLVLGNEWSLLLLLLLLFFWWSVKYSVSQLLYCSVQKAAVFSIIVFVAKPLYVNVLLLGFGYF